MVDTRAMKGENEVDALSSTSEKGEVDDGLEEGGSDELIVSDELAGAAEDDLPDSERGGNESFPGVDGDDGGEEEEEEEVLSPGL